MLTNLAPFVTNVASFEPQDVPLDGLFDDNRVRVRLPYRMGTRLDMNVTRSISATLTLLELDGQPVPAGAQVTLEGADETFYVARKGRVFVSGLKPGDQTVRVTGGEFVCRATVHLPEGFVSGTSLGPFTCE